MNRETEASLGLGFDHSFEFDGAESVEYVFIVFNPVLERTLVMNDSNVRTLAPMVPVFVRSVNLSQDIVYDID